MKLVGTPPPSHPRPRDVPALVYTAVHLHRYARVPFVALFFLEPDFSSVVSPTEPADAKAP